MSAAPTARHWLLISWLMLLLPPLLLFGLNIQLFPLLDLSSTFANINYAITMTGTRPWGALTSVIVLSLLWWQLPKQQRWLLLTATLLALGLNLLVSHGLKNLFQESRPYVEYLAQKGLINLQHFYDADSAGRAAILDALSRSHLPLPISAQVWQQWQFETGYSFPSGHTLFSCTLALSGCYALLAQRKLLLPLLLICWAWWVSLSRILLGMHWPVDVLVSALLSGIIVLVSFALVRRIFLKVQPTTTDN